MIAASYVVIRYIPDAARNEALNVGLLAWRGPDHWLSIDDEAVARVIRENPRLHKDALLELDEMVRDHLRLREGGEPDLAAASQRTASALLVTEPRRTTISDATTEALRDAADRLVNRIVRPRRRSGGRDEAPFVRLERELRPLMVRRAVVVHHFFRATTTGVPRRVDFFANSGANVAVDVLQLNLKVADQIRLRADAQANKARDIIEANDVRLLLLAEFSFSDDVAQASGEARKILDHAPVEVLEDVESVAAELTAIVKR